MTNCIVCREGESVEGGKACTSCILLIRRQREAAYPGRPTLEDYEWEDEHFPSWVKEDPEAGIDEISRHLMNEIQARSANGGLEGDFELRVYLVCRALRKRL